MSQIDYLATRNNVYENTSLENIYIEREEEELLIRVGAFAKSR